jgi:hypothetical protein
MPGKFIRYILMPTKIRNDQSRYKLTPNKSINTEITLALLIEKSSKGIDK